MTSRAGAIRWNRCSGPAGVTLGQGGQDAQAEPPAATLDHTCVLGPDAPSPSEAAAQPWLAGLMARSDALNRAGNLGRYAPTR